MEANGGKWRQMEANGGTKGVLRENDMYRSELWGFVRGGGSLCSMTLIYAEHTCHSLDCLSISNVKSKY
jgi:hypothetical protein